MLRLLSARSSLAAFFALAALACGGGDGGTPPPNLGGFTVALSTTTLSIEQGASGSVTATIGRTGSFTGTVTLTTENLPAGLTASITPSSITSSTTSATLTVNVAASVAPGPYSFTIRGQASGLADQTAAVSLTVTARPAIAVALTPAAATVIQGSNTSFAATVSRTNFTGAVAVAVTNLPAGTTSSISTTGDVHTVTLTVGANTAPGTYPLTVTASGTGVTAAATQFQLTVATPPSGYTLTLTPAALSIPATLTGQTTVDLVRNNFNGAVTLTLEGAPTGVTGAFATSPLAGNATTLAVTVQASVAPGTYSLTVRGSAAGLADRTATLALTVQPAPSITLGASPNAVTAVRGGAGVATTLSIARTNFTGPVTLSAAGVPVGVTVAFNTSPTTGNSASATFTATNQALPGAYTVTFTGTGTGIANGTVQVSLTVADPSSISLSATPTALTIAQGASNTTTLTIGRISFPGAVTLAASNVPSGVTVSFSTNQTAGNTVTATVAVSNSATAGTYSLTFTASGSGVTDATTQVGLTVTQVATSGNVTYTFCGTSVPIWVAYKDGNGSWTRAVAGASNTYSFNITTAGGVAWVTQDAAGEYDLTIYYGSLAELQGDGTNRCTTPGTKSHPGSVSGLAFTESGSITMGGATASVNFVTPTFTLQNVANTALDLVAVRSAISGSGTTANNVVITRGLNLPNNQNLGVIGFGGGGSITPSTHTATITGLVGGETVVGANTFLTATGSSGALTALANIGSSFQFAAIPTASSISTDLHVLSAIATVGVGPTSSFRSVANTFRNPGNASLALGPTLASETISNLGTAPYLRLRLQATRQSEYNNAWAFGWSQGTSGSRRDGTIFATSAYFGAGATVDLSIPDFTGVSGWSNAWAPTNGSGNYSFNAFGWNVTAGGASTPNIEGAVSKVGSRLGTF